MSARLRPAPIVAPGSKGSCEQLLASKSTGPAHYLKVTRDASAYDVAAE
jgi:hypothetical protein